MADEGFKARQKAENQRSSGNIDGALRTLEDYLITDPHNNRVRMDLARIYIYDAKKVDFGLLQLDAILDIDPDYDDARKALVTILKKNKRYNDETEMHFKILLEKYPDDPDLLHSWGIFCREQLLDFTQAKQVFARCVELRPRDESYRLSYASCLANDFREYSGTRVQLQAALDINPSNMKTQAALKRLEKRKYRKDKGRRGGLIGRLTK